MGLWSRKSIAVLQREAAEEGEHGLRRTLSATNLTLLGIGAIIGAGIFVLTGNAAAQYAGPAVVISKILAGATTYGAAVDKLFLALTFQKPTAATRRALLAFLHQAASAPLPPQVRNGDFHLRVQLPALILGGPQHQLR